MQQGETFVGFASYRILFSLTAISLEYRETAVGQFLTGFLGI
jgi:hypothetical protein